MAERHPGRTKAQREALDQIGCGVYTPRMSQKTRDALLRLGLIEECGKRVLGRDALGEIALTEYQMPTLVHMQWCSAVAAPTPPE